MPRRCCGTPGRGRNLVRGTDIVDGTHDAPDGLVLLDEWQVGLFIDEGALGRVVDEIRWMFEAELATWGQRFVTELRASGLLRIDVTR
jgi:hypothetical protein